MPAHAWRPEPPARDGDVLTWARDQIPRLSAAILAAVIATPLAAEPDMPPGLWGVWRSDCGAMVWRELAFSRDGATLIGSDDRAFCRLVGLRTMSATRWYLDFTCADGSVATLDAIKMSPRDLLVAVRPLGEACRYRPGD